MNTELLSYNLKESQNIGSENSYSNLKQWIFLLLCWNKGQKIKLLEHSLSSFLEKCSNACLLRLPLGLLPDVH